MDVTELMGNEIYLYLVIGEHSFVARVDPRSRYTVGEEIDLVFNMDKIHLFDPAADPDNPVAIN